MQPACAGFKKLTIVFEDELINYKITFSDIWLCNKPADYITIYKTTTVPPNAVLMINREANISRLTVVSREAKEEVPCDGHATHM